jgi:hypothetical protein
MFLDGKPVAHFTDLGFSGTLPYDITADGVLTVVSRIDGALKKVVITPDPAWNLTTLLAASKPPPAN